MSDHTVIVEIINGKMEKLPHCLEGLRSMAFIHDVCFKCCRLILESFGYRSLNAQSWAVYVCRVDVNGRWAFDFLNLFSAGIVHRRQILTSI